jgi:hypothetical protein
VLPFRLIYFERYDLNLGAHVFPSQKYRLLSEHLLKTGFASPEDFVAPEPASDTDMRLVHDEQWVAKLRSGTLSPAELARMEIPYSPELIHAIWLATEEPSWLAGSPSRPAWDSTSAAASITPSRTRRGILRDQRYRRRHSPPSAGRRDPAAPWWSTAMSTTAMAPPPSSQGDPSVFTLSIHQWNNYPAEKPPSDLDIHVDDRHRRSRIPPPPGQRRPLCPTAVSGPT